jgi:hypothetical protein
MTIRVWAYIRAPARSGQFFAGTGQVHHARLVAFSTIAVFVDLVATTVWAGGLFAVPVGSVRFRWILTFQVLVGPTAASAREKATRGDVCGDRRLTTPSELF